MLDGMLGGDGMLGVLLVGGGDWLWHPDRMIMQMPSVAEIRLLCMVFPSRSKKVMFTDLN